MAVTVRVQFGVPVWASLRLTVHDEALAGPFWRTYPPLVRLVAKPPPTTEPPAAQVAVTVLVVVVFWPKLATAVA